MKVVKLFLWVFSFCHLGLMAHLVENGVANDGSWSLTVLITDMNIQRNLFVTGGLHIGGLMLKLVDEIGLLVVC